ncbi:MAG: hypothetical protein HGB03_03860 [Candidatus Yonathbacteria bacterium]|nr:hypothetical protein [Candidatus Yonathbacteria bacterium]NTW47633.1 hypothetical protein [Candidatus Yonathbacteria bacterium]
MHQPISSYLPSKRFIAIVGVIIIFIGIAYGITRLGNVPEKTLPLASAYVPTDYDPNADYDDDGLSNWEEALWGTNPEQVDSDGDGTPDSIELLTQRNPLINAVDDSLSIYPAIPSLESTETGYGNRTESVAQAFMSHLYAYGMSGDDISGKADVLNDIIANEAGNNKLVDAYTRVDIAVGPADVETLRAYGNIFGTQLSAYEALGEPYEMTIIKESIIDGNGTNIAGLARLDRFIVFFEGMRNTLLSTRVPENLKDAHLELVNGVNNMKRALVMIRDTEHDTLTGVIGISEYRTALERITRSTATFADACATSDVSFSPGEGGYIFMSR